MKTIIKLLMVFGCSVAIAAEHVPFPPIYFEYGIAMDKLVCDSPKPITDEMNKELDTLTPMFEQMWLQDSPELLDKVQQTFGGKFEDKRTGLVANLLLCGNIPSMSFPLIVNARKWLKTADTDPSPYSFFVPVVLHELLHRYLWENFQSLYDTSPLLKKYESEGVTITYHLHLMAIMKFVYLSLHKEAELQMIVQEESRYSNPDYKRAWQIVNDIEGYQPFIDELLKAKSGK